MAAVLGITGGAVTAMVADHDDSRAETLAAFEDPLGLGIPLVRLDCHPAQGVLVLGFGDTAPALRTAIKDNPSGDPTYLETATLVRLPDSAARPDLRVAMTRTDASAVWVRSLQGMFNDAFAEDYPPEWVTDNYDF